MFVYLITNIIDGKRYVGQTRQTLAKRWLAHTSKNRCRYLYNAIMKYGKENFIIEPICEVPTRELANEFEIEYIDRYKTLAPNGYNICVGGDNRTHSWLGKKHSEASKLKMSISRKRHSGPNKGREFSGEWREKLRLAKLGKPSNRKGTHASEETRLKMSQSQQARRLREHV